MGKVSKRHRDIAMRAIIDFYDSCPDPETHYILPGYLSDHGLPNKVDPDKVVNVLSAMGYISVTRPYGETHRKITLTDTGKCYFENQADKNAEQRSRRLHDWLIAIFSALVGALASEPLWRLIHWIFSRGAE